MANNKLKPQHQRLAEGENIDGQSYKCGGPVKKANGGSVGIKQGKLNPVKPSSGAPGKPNSLKGPVDAGKGSTGKKMKGDGV